MVAQVAQVLQNPRRLAALYELGMLDTPAEQAFDRLSRLAARILKTPVALVSLVDSDRQFFKSCLGLPEPWSRWRETPLSHSFCQHVVATGQPLVVPDARRDPHLLDNLAIRDLNVIAYLGSPLILSGGQVIGSFCVIDTKPRAWTDEQISIVRDLAASVMTEIGLRHASSELERRVQERTRDLRTTNEALSESESRYRELVELAADGIFISDADGRFIEVNAAGCELSGYAREEVLSRGFNDLIPGTDREHDPPRLEELHAGRTIVRERRVLHKDGTIVPVEISVKQLPSGRLQGIVRDITARKKVEAERERLLAELAARNVEMESFIYTISHDLKTPLITINGFASVLAQMLPRGDTPEARDSLAEIAKAAEVMKKHIEDLLTLSRIGRVVAEMNALSMDVFLTEVLSNFAQRLRSANGRVELAPDLPTLLVARDGFIRVFSNLLDNAIKYRRPEAPLVIEIGWRHDAGEIRLFVRDNGQGIKPQFQHRIFGLFQRADSRTEGTGVGLAISKRVVETHGGTMWVESQPGQGSTFWIGLPGSALIEP